MSQKDMYADLDEVTLRQLLLEAVKANSTLSGGEKTAKEEEIDKIKVWLKEACDERLRREAGLTETINASGSNSERNQRMRDMKMSVDSIPRFTPGMCIQVFINQLNNKYKLYVECDDKSDQAALETSFLRHAQSRLCDEFLTQITNESKVFDSFDGFTKYLMDNYDSKQTLYQRMETLLSHQLKTNENYSEFHARLSNCGHEVLLMMSERAKTSFGDKKLTAKRFMEILMGQIFLNSIPKQVYTLMAPNLDDVWSVSELATKAMAIKDRVTDFGESGGYLAKAKNRENGGSSGDGGYNGARKRRDNKRVPIADQKCYFWMDGACRKGDDCPRRHDPNDFGVGRPSKKVDEPMSMVSLASFQN